MIERQDASLNLTSIDKVFAGRVLLDSACPTCRPKLPRDTTFSCGTSRSASTKLKFCASTSVNRELILLYWQIGRDILSRQKTAGWGAKIVDRLAKDLRVAFPDMRGFSRANLMYMRAFAEAYPEIAIVQQVVGQIPWGHNTILINRVKQPEHRLWYARQTIQFGWSRNILAHHIETDLHARQGKSLTNFDKTLPAPQSELAQQLLKDPYNFEFLTLGSDARERELERGLLDHLRMFLLELGAGFAFVGSQYPLTVDDEEFFIDLLFYHLKLRCYIVIDLKMQKFKPEFAGKMNFYLSAVDDMLRHADDKPSIGIILCKTKSKTIAEYALRDTHKPIGISEHRTSAALPDLFKGSLPTIEELEAELQKSEK